MDRIENPKLMEPCLPPEGTRNLEELGYELVTSALRLTAKLSPETVVAIAAKVRSMNCYYSNLIEGHNTHPIDIERALHGDYSTDSSKRCL